MATATKRSRASLAEYMALVGEFPLVPIKSEGHLRSAFRMVDRLSMIDEDKMSTAQADYLFVLTDLVERYELEQGEAAQPFSSPADALRYLCTEAGMTASDLGRLLGNRQLGAALLRGDREPSKLHIARLCDHFKVSADLFLLTAATV